MKKMIDDDRKGVKDNAYQIYQLLTLELWLRTFIDKDEQELSEVMTSHLTMDER